MPEPDVHHRLSAILAADAAGFSRLMAADERATVAALDAARLVFRSHILAHQGRVIDMAGDSVLAVFDTAIGAVNAAMAIQLSVSAAAEPLTPERRMQFRIGVHLGDVIEKSDGSVYGDGVNIAARLESLAVPGGIAVSDAVHGVVRGRLNVPFVDQGEQRLKNIPRPIRVFALGGSVAAGMLAAPAEAQAAPPRAPGSAAPHGPRPRSLFIGRDAEMAQLAKALERARKGFGQVVFLAGCGGIGKTRLAQQLAARAEQQGLAVLWGRCLEEPGAPPYWPWRQVIRSRLRLLPEGTPASGLGAGALDIASFVPELAERYPELLPGAGLDQDAALSSTSASRFRLFDAVAAFWRRAAQQAPLVLVFEDLHWADATSLRLLSYLANDLEASPVLMLGTYRSNELQRQHPLTETLAELARASAFHRIELAGLSSRETEQFISTVSSGRASAGLARAIHGRTEGHPLYL